MNKISGLMMCSVAWTTNKSYGPVASFL